MADKITVNGKEVTEEELKAEQTKAKTQKGVELQEVNPNEFLKRLKG